jgi:hypothetical protein
LQPPQHCWLLCEYLAGGTLSQWLHGERMHGGRSWPCFLVDRASCMPLMLSIQVGDAKHMRTVKDDRIQKRTRELEPNNCAV